MTVVPLLLALTMVLSACTNTDSSSIAMLSPTIASASQQGQTPATSTLQTGWNTEQLLSGADGQIHYSYYLPESYDASKYYPMVVAMPGYDRMWFGKESSGRNLDWNGVQVWTEQEEDIIVVSAQLTDWGKTSARQSIELTEYFLQNFSIDKSRVYATGYSAGGETMSQAVSMRSDLYAAYLHGASQWDGSYEPVVEHGVAVYIFMAEHDAYYGSPKALDAYSALQEVYRADGWTAAQIDEVLQLEIPPDSYFNDLGITNYHGGGNVMYEDGAIINWILQKHK